MKYNYFYLFFFLILKIKNNKFPDALNIIKENNLKKLTKYFFLTI